MFVSADGQALTESAAADLLEGMMDDQGNLPTDDNYEEPEASPEVDTEESDEEQPEGEPEDSGDDAEDEDQPGETEEEPEEVPETPEDEPEADKLYDIEIDGEVYEVNMEELQAGYLRNEQLVKRQTELESQFAEKERQLEEKEIQLTQELDNVIAGQAVELAQYQRVNWEQLKAEDPDQYAVLRAQYFDAQERFQQNRERQRQVLELRNKAEELKHQAYLRTQGELVRKLVPEFEDPEFQKTLVAFGEKLGYTENEVRSISNARDIYVLNQARLYAETQARRKAAEEKKVSKEVPPVLKPGAPKATGQEQKQKAKAAAQRFAKSHSARDAAQLFLDSGVI